MGKQLKDHPCVLFKYDTLYLLNMSTWNDYVQLAQSLGFTKVTITNRSTYQTLASSSGSDVATAWMDGDVQINENQELLDDWSDKKKFKFCFYKQKFNILIRDEDDASYIVCLNGKTVCIAKQFNSVWIVVSGDVQKKGKGAKAKKKKGDNDEEKEKDEEK